MDARASIVSHNLNTLIKKFTIWTIAIMMANLVVGVFSMNVELPMPTEGKLWPFMMVNALAILVSVGIIWFSRFRKW
jgi:magnesium transporter